MSCLAWHTRCTAARPVLTSVLLFLGLPDGSWCAARLASPGDSAVTAAASPRCLDLRRTLKDVRVQADAYSRAKEGKRSSLCMVNLPNMCNFNHISLALLCE